MYDTATLCRPVFVVPSPAVQQPPSSPVTTMSMTPASTATSPCASLLDLPPHASPRFQQRQSMHPIDQEPSFGTRLDSHKGYVSGPDRNCCDCNCHADADEADVQDGEENDNFFDAKDSDIGKDVEHPQPDIKKNSLPKRIENEHKLPRLPTNHSLTPSRTVPAEPGLPLPSTTRRQAPTAIFRSAVRRSVPLLVALIVAILLLLCLTSSFFSELNKLDVNNQVQLSSAPKENFAPEGIPARHVSRKTSFIPNSNGRAQHGSDGLQLRSKLRTLQHINTVLSSILHQSPTAFFLVSLPHLRVNRMGVPFLIPKVRLALPQVADPISPTRTYQTSDTLSAPSQQSLIPPLIPNAGNLSNNNWNGLHTDSTKNGPISVPSAIIIAPQDPIITVAQMPSALPPPQPLHIPPMPMKVPTGTTFSHSTETLVPTESPHNLLHDGSLNVVDDVVDVMADIGKQPGPQPTQQPLGAPQSQAPALALSDNQANESLFLQTPVKDAMPESKLMASHQPHSGKPIQLLSQVESIEVWHLPRGKQLCRIFNVGRSNDGRLVLPKWMEKHKAFLETNCGISKISFGIIVRERRIQLDREIMKKEFGDSHVLDLSHSDRDLFGSDAPRHHMPHYVSDIIKPLVAVEVLLGSGRNMLTPSSLLKSAKDTTLVRSMRLTEQFKPSMLMLPGTWKRSKADWVRRLAHFFEHPALGFTMIPSHEVGKLNMKVHIFHSVLSSNVNPYEPYGLFGTTGKNILFATNGISREPPWTMNAMRERPCRVLVTALTRSGARKLLHLDRLERAIKAKAAAAHMKADFRIVDFNSMSFDNQVQTMQETHILIATHGAGNANIIFMRPGAAVVEVFPFSYKAGPFDGFAKIFGLEYSTAMSAPQTNVFKACMKEHEKNDFIRRLVFEKWDSAVKEEQATPWVHRLEFEKEFGEPGKSQGMTTRGCVRLQQLDFNVDAVADIAITAGKSQCYLSGVSK